MILLRTKAVITAIFGIVLLVAGLSVFHSWNTPREVLLSQARAELAEKNYQKAADLVRRLLSQSPDDEAALLVAAEVAMRQKDLEAALSYYRRIPPDGSPAAVAALFGAGEILFHQGHLSESERSLRQALSYDPRHLLSRYRLAYILDITGRRWEATEHHLELVRQGEFSVESLLTFADSERVVHQPQLLVVCRQAVPDDPLPQLGLARLAIAHNDSSSALELLRRVAARIPEEIEGQVRLGAMLLYSGRIREFLDWHARVSQRGNDHPETWVVRGEFARGQGQLSVAVRCFGEALLREPNHRVANYQLGQVLTALGPSQQAEPFLRRADQLQQLGRSLESVFQNRADMNAMREIALLMETLGRDWEAWAWAKLAMSAGNQQRWAAGIVARVGRRLNAQLPRTVASRSAIQDFDLSAYPLPDLATFSAAEVPVVNRPVPGPAIRFEEIAASVGIDFVYFNRPDPDKPGARTYEGTGGGVAAVDYDGDLRPDLYFTQGSRDPRSEGSAELQDRLFRNLPECRALDVTQACGLGDMRYSQGVSAGDFNNDGFPDLYVANIGLNRLYVNNGDGTFDDVTSMAGLLDSSWTTSCLIADLNGDSLPDLYDVNYCNGDQVFQRLCQQDGLMRSCGPLAFDPAPDRVFINLGDGTFEDVTETSGIDVPRGYGLGIIAADFSGNGSLNLFIANDATANFLFVNETTSGDRKLKLVERGLLSGVALNGDGLAQGSMGIAVGDANEDGMCDLLVTNFYEEGSTLYIQQAEGQFLDATRGAGLRDPSFKMLGFGTQFLDADLDGRPDLVVANGHIDDMSELGIPFKMQPQFFRNVGKGSFVEIPSETLGAYFARKSLGRGLARLDWDCDGKDDFAVSQIGSPAALVVNRTEMTGNSFAVHLRGTSSARDAIGATVRLTAGGKTTTQQLTAGDGYQASNERRLVFGLGDNRTIERLAVRWPSGLEQEVTDVGDVREVLWIEGRAGLVSVTP